MKKFILFAISIIIAGHSFAQLKHKADQIFDDWNQKSNPGGVVYITKGEKVMYSNAFGLANVQYAIPNTIESVFNIGSVSKQFTALGIALLSQTGEINIDDSIQVYLPELPDFKNTITLRHLLHHTSGLRSTPELFILAGWREGDEIRTEDVFNYVCKQTDLNFTPGSEFMYSNTNYVLLAMIIARVTHQNFTDWMKSNIFDPLGMKNTYIDDSNLKRFYSTSTPYFQVNENEFTIIQNPNLDLGASNVYSSVPDLNKWIKQLNNPESKWKDAIQFLLTSDTLTNGQANNYCFGLINDEFNGNKRIFHNGGVPGYLSFVMTFPDEQLSVIVLTNYLDSKINQRVDALLNLILKNKSQQLTSSNELNPVPLNLKNAENYVADYWNNDKNYSRSVYLDNDTLWYQRTIGNKSPLIQIEDSLFVLGGVKTIVRVQFRTLKDKIYMFVKDGDKVEQIFEPYINSPVTSTEITNYCGTYYSSELETTYTIAAMNDELIGYHSRHGTFPITILKKDLVGWADFAVARYLTNNKDEVIGFYVSLDRVRNVWFEKQ